MLNLCIQGENAVRRVSAALFQGRIDKFRKIY